MKRVNSLAGLLNVFSDAVRDPRNQNHLKLLVALLFLCFSFVCIQGYSIHIWSGISVMDLVPWFIQNNHDKIPGLYKFVY